MNIRPFIWINIDLSERSLTQFGNQLTHSDGVDGNNQNALIETARKSRMEIKTYSQSQSGSSLIYKS